MLNGLMPNSTDILWCVLTATYPESVGENVVADDSYQVVQIYLADVTLGYRAQIRIYGLYRSLGEGYSASVRSWYGRVQVHRCRTVYGESNVFYKIRP